MDKITPLEVCEKDKERAAFCELQPAGFFIRHPPAAHTFEQFITADDMLFQTIHMGAAVVDQSKWMLVVDGLVERPFALSLTQLKALPRRMITSFHECYGSPIKPPTDNVWRIGNVKWTGVPLRALLSSAIPHADARYVWSDGLDRGEFATVKADRYQKDLPIDKAWSDEVLIAYEINGQPLSKERGGPVRLIVPGWFGTNSTKWLCRLTVERTRATGPFTTVFYNEVDPHRSDGAKRPVWSVEPNSLIQRPANGSTIVGSHVEVTGWAWANEDIAKVQICTDQGSSWSEATVSERVDFSWQAFSLHLDLPTGTHELMARATTASGEKQPLNGRRNHVHRINISVIESTHTAIDN